MVIRWCSSEFKMIWLLVNDDGSVFGVVVVDGERGAREPAIFLFHSLCLW